MLRDLRAPWNVHRATVEERLGEPLDAFNALVRERGLSTVPAPTPIRWEPSP